MSIEKWDSIARGIDRREFFKIGLETAAALAVLPAASVLAGCGSGEERATTTASSPPAKPSEPAPAPRAEKPPAAPDPAPVAAGDTESQLVTEIAGVASMVTALQYVNQSPKADQNCENCQLYTAGSGGRGKCQLFPQGLVTATGHCASWVAKVT